jgi:YVTN family beta-propeller protein
MILGMMALAAPIGNSRAEATPTPAWTAYVVNGDTITPVDTTTNTAGTPITGFALPVGIAITPNGATAYVTDSFDKTVTPIDLATDTPETPITVTGGSSADTPAAIAITPNGATAYVTSGNTLVWPINLATGTVGTPITVQFAQNIAITPNGATAYVTDPYDNVVTPINLATNTPETPITGISFPSAIAITPNGATAYVTSEGGSIATPINLTTNTPGTPITVAGLPSSAEQPFAIAITPNGSTAYVASGEGDLGINGPGEVTPINTATNTAGTPIPVGDNPLGIAVTPDGSTAYVTIYGCIPPPPPVTSSCSSPDNIVTPINTATNAAGTSVTVGTNPARITFTPDQAPVARLSVTPAVAGQPTSFDASASTVAVGTITSYAWNFGDGSLATTSTPTTTHTYTTPGPYTATVTETDSAGTSTTQVFTGQTMSNNGGPSAVASESFTVTVEKPPTTSVLLPSNGATLSGSSTLDASASNATSVEFRLFGGIYGYAAPVICTATPTIYGWLCNWNTSTVPNGSYVLLSEAFNSAGSTFSSGVSVTVSKPPATSILLPSNGATLSGSTYLDASASNATSVKFLLFGGSYGYNAPVLCTATPTIYGWLCAWNATTVPNGAYTLVSEATNSSGVTGTAGVSITVDNPTVSFAGSTVFTYPSESVGVTLSQSSTNTVQVDFTSAGGPGAQLFWGAWTGGASSFSPSSGTVTFAPGQTTATIPLTVNPTTVTGCDTTTPCYPSVTITLTDPTNAVLGSTTVTNVFYAPVPGS